MGVLGGAFGSHLGPFSSITKNICIYKFCFVVALSKMHFWKILFSVTIGPLGPFVCSYEPFELLGLNLDVRPSTDIRPAPSDP